MCACLQKPGWEFEISAKCAPSVSCLRVWWNRKTLGFLKSVSVCERERELTWGLGIGRYVANTGGLTSFI